MAISAPAFVKKFFLWVAATLSQLWHPTKSQLPITSPASSPNINPETQSPQTQPQPSSSDTVPESQSTQTQPPPSPQSPSGVQEPQKNVVVAVKQEWEKEMPKTLLNLCFTAAVQITIQYKQAVESELCASIHFLSLAILAIFTCLFISQFIGKKLPAASKVLENVASFLAAATFFFAVAIPFPMRVKCALSAVYIMSLIVIAICNINEPQSGVQEPSPPSIDQPPQNNVVDAEQDLEMDMPKTLLNLCFTAAAQITIQYKQAVESELCASIHFLSLAILAIFTCLFISQFIGKKLPAASKVLENVASFLAAATFFFSVAIPFPLSVKCAIWAVYIMSLITIAICNCL